MSRILPVNFGLMMEIVFVFLQDFDDGLDIHLHRRH